MRTTYYIKAILFILITCSCNILNDESGFEFQNPEIYFHDSGGGWGTGPSLNIDQNGKVILASLYPNLEYQLSAEEHAAIKKVFKSFDSFEKKYQSVCRDTPVYRIQLKEGRKKKDVEIEYCRLQELKNREGKRLRNIVTTMLNLSDSVYKEKAEWIGLETRYYSNKSNYLEGESIELFFELINPTDKQRTIYFNQEEQINFDLNNFKFQSQGVRYANIINQDYNREVRTEITLDPGEIITKKYIWNQVVDSENDTKLEPGNYTLIIYYVTPYLNNFSFDLEIIDSGLKAISMNP